jgi:hypothetical protein
MLKPWVLGGLKAYMRLPHSGARPKHMQEPDLRMELAYGMLSSSHSGLAYIRTKRKGVHQTRSLA